MRKISALLMLALSLTACEKKTHPIYHAQNGNYYTQNDAGEWLMLYLIINGQQTPYVASTSSTAPASRSFSPPPGASWGAAKAAPTKEELEESQEEEDPSEESESESSESESSDEGGGDSDGGSDGGGGGE